MRLFKLINQKNSNTLPGGRYWSESASANRRAKLKRAVNSLKAFGSAFIRTALGYTFVVLCSTLAANGQTSISGVVFRDYNGDGIQGKAYPNMESGVAEIPVCAFDSLDQLLSVVLTDDQGYYAMPLASVPAGRSVRLEFIIQGAGSSCYNDRTYDYSSTSAATYGSAIRFVKGGTANVNFAMNYAGDYVLDNNPYIYMSCFFMGDPLKNGTAASSSAFIKVRDSYSGEPISQGGSSTDNPISIARADSIGSVWGNAYSRPASKIFVSAFMKRHVGLGPLGSGGVYMIDPSATFPATTQQFFDLDALGFPTRAASGALAVLSNAQRGLDADASVPSHDSAAYYQIGKVGIGGLEVSDDGRYLYLINLFDRKLYKIDLRNGSSPLAPQAAHVTSYAIPDPGCTNGVARAFAVKYYRKKVYVGVVCTGENGGSNNTAGLPTDVYANVYAFDAVTNTFNATPVIPEVDLNFHKGQTNASINPNDTMWNAWDNNWHADNGGEITYPQPILSDIEFDNDGSMIISFMDRLGHQLGLLQYGLDPNDATNYTGYAGGDIIRVYNDACSYVLENNGTAGPITTAGAGNYEGLGSGEFYWEDKYAFWFDETCFGSLCMRAGDSVVTVSAAAPQSFFGSGGISHFSNIDGSKTYGYQIYDPTIIGTCANANGLGDMEFGDVAADIEIGNIVWNDTHNFGIQDADEAGIDGVKIQLVRASDNVVIANTTTAQGGLWYFNKSNINLGGATRLLPNTAYKIRVDATQYNGTGNGPLGGKAITPAGVIGNGEPGMSDNDASDVGGRAEISFTSGNPGANNHNLDFGFKSNGGCSITATCSSTDVTCNGGFDGSASVSVSLSSGGETYLWSNGSTTSSLSAPLPAGSYLVTVTDNSGCTAQCTAVVGEPAALALTCSGTDVTINGGNDGSATVAVSGGTPPYGYLWSNGNTNSSQTTLTAGTYIVTVTDGNGCTAGCSATILQPLPLSISAVITSVDCSGNLTGEVDITASGGISPYNYNWSNGATTEDITGLSAGTYIVTVTDAAGASVSLSNPVIEPSALLANCTSIDVTTNGGSNGSASVTASGGSAPYSYLWSNGNTTDNNTGLVAGAYTVTVSDNNGCTTTCEANVGSPGLIVASINETNVSCNGGSNGSLDLSVSGGVQPYSYLWDNGQTTEDISGLTAGSYSVTITDINGATITVAGTVSEPAALVPTCTHTNVTIHGLSDGTATASASGGTLPYTYLWTNGQTTATATGLDALIYNVLITDANGCTTTCSSVITQPAVFSGTVSKINVSCNGGSDGSINITSSGGVTPYSYLWSNAGTTEDQSGLSAGTYTVTATDANGATYSKTVNITEPALLEAQCTHTDILIYGANDGTGSVTMTGGTPPYTYSWNNGSTTNVLSNLPAGTYFVNVTDANGCSAACSFTVLEPTILELNISGSNVTCNNGSNGTIDVTTTGGVSPYNYIWNDGDTNEDRSNVTAGVYVVTATDANGATLSQSINISEPSPVTASCSKTNITINGANDGSACVLSTGGVPPHVFTWSNGASTQCISALSPGLYTVTVTDNNGCSENCQVNITQPASINVVPTPSNVSCYGGSDGAISVVVTGGVTPYSYAWNDGTTADSRTGLSAGTYTITVTDVNGATAVAVASVAQPTVLSATCAATDVTINGLANGTASASASGGTSPYDYLWNNGETTAAINNLSPGSYTVTVTDNNGCTIECTSTIAEPALLQATGTAVDVSCNGLTDGSIDLTASGGVAPYNYLWDDGTTTEDRIGLTAGTYYATVTDYNGATATTSVVVAEPNNINTTCIGTDVSINGGNNGSACALANGGTSPYNYAWSNGATSQCASGLTAGSYVVVITDAKGCSVSCSVIINEPDALSATAVITDISCNGLTNGSVQVTAAGGNPPYTFLWNNGSTSSSIGSLAAGAYTVTVTDASGGTFEITSTITEPTLLVANCSATDITINGANDGTASVSATGGTPAYSYLWSNGTTTAITSALAAGVYEVTITDNNGCTTTCSTIVNEPTPLTSGAQSTNNLCYGASTGTATVTASGGITPYTYLWSNGSTNDNISGLVAGTYFVTVTDANGAVSTSSATVSDPSQLAIVCSSTDITIFGADNGTASVNVTGGTTPYSYTWNNGSTTDNINGLSAGTYTVVVTDANGCSTDCQATIIEPEVLTVTVQSTNVMCYGGNDGTALPTVTGGVTPYTYLWSDASTTANRNDLAKGTYMLTVTDANGATATAGVVITQPDLLTLNCSHIDVSGAGAGDGSACALPSLGTPPYAYLWNTSSTDQCINNLPGGAYTVTVTDANGCTTSCINVVYEPGLYTISASGSDITCNGLNDGEIDVTVVGGVQPLSYLWDDGNTNEDRNGLVAGTYTVIVTDNTGATLSAITTIAEPAVLAVVLTPNDVTIFGAGDGSVTSLVSGGTAPYTYWWNNAATTSDINNLDAGLYVVEITDANGCTTSAQATVNTPTPLAAKIVVTPGTGGPAICYTTADLTAVVTGGVLPYAYLWSNGDTNAAILNAAPGTYTVTITDFNGATTEETKVFVAALPPSVTCSGTNVSQNGGNDGTASVNILNAVGNETIMWSNGDFAATTTNLTAGTYTVTVTNSAGCTATCEVIITEPAILSVSAVSTDVVCHGEANGTASASATGGLSPYTYLWSNGETTDVISGLSAGTYTITTTDNGGSNASTVVVVSEPSALVANCTATNISENGFTDGTASVQASGGTPPYTYVWSNGATTATIIGLGAGTYTVTVYDAHQCVAGCSSIINEPGVLSLSLTTTEVNCYNGNDGTVTSVVSGGVAPYTYAWSNGSTNAALSNATAGTYILTVSDVNNVSVTSSATLTNPPAIVVSCSGTDVSCGTIPDGTLSVSASGGTGTFTYLWSNGATDANVTGVAAGNYTVTVSDSRNCYETCTVTINGGTAGLCSIKKLSPITCNGGSNGALEVITTGNNSYLWSNGATTAVVTGLPKGVYYVTVTNISGCTSTCSVCLFEPKLLVCSTSSTDATCSACNGSATVTVTGGVQPYTYLWNTGATSSTLSNLCGGNYDVTVTDKRGCVTNCSVKVDAVSTIMSCTIIKNNLITCNGGSDGAMAVNVTGGKAPYTYVWSNGATTYAVIGLSTGTYTVTVTDANGCSTNCSVFLGQPAKLTCATASTPASCNACNGTATVTVTGGVAPYSYLWSNGETTSSISNLCDGNYSVTVTDKRGCVTSCNVKVDPAGSKIVCNVVKNHLITCNGGSDGTISVNVVGGLAPLSYNWSNGATTATITGLSMGSYVVTVTDANGCSTTCSSFLGQPLPLVCNTNSTAATCGLCNGSAMVAVTGGVAPYTYLWSNGATTDIVNGICGGNYSVNITDARGCQTSCTVKVDNIDENFSCTISKDHNLACHGDNNGIATVTPLGGTAPYTYAWSNGATTATIGNLSAGAYTVVVTSAAGCTSTCSVCFVNPAQLTCTASATGATCNACNGTATVTAAGGKAPYTYLWSNGSTSATITGLCGGSYNVTVTDKKGCVTNCVVKVDDISDNTKVTITKNNGITCHGGNDGALMANASGGTAPYSYLWSNGTTTAQATGLSKGTYTVTVTSAYGCTAMATFTLTQPTAVTCNTQITESTCGLCNGTATVSAAGGTAPYAILWSNGQQSATATGLCAGNYDVTVTDASGCITVCHATVTNAGDDVKCTIDLNTAITCNGAANAVITAAASGGTAPYTYLWSNGFTTPTLSGLAAGTYTVTVTSALGCTSQCTITVTQPAVLTCTTISKDAVCKKCNGNATVIAAGGTAPYTYLWINGKTTATASALCAGKYTVIVADANGCTTECEVTVHDAAITCNGFVTGHKQNYYNPSKRSLGGHKLADYLDSNFTYMFPTGLTVGAACPGAYGITLNSAAAVKTFLPSTGTTALLTQSYVDPLPGMVNNELASQLVALALNIRFDLLDPNFSPNSTVAFKDMVVDSGPMAGMTVMEVFNEGNAALSGCGSKFTRALIRTYLAHINSSWSLGIQRNSVLTCPKDPCGKTLKALTQEEDFLQFGAYPNPTQGILNMEFIDTDVHPLTIQLYDVQSKLVYEQNAYSTEGYNSITLNMSDMPKGIYILKATVNFDTRVVRVILQ